MQTHLKLAAGLCAAALPLALPVAASHAGMSEPETRYFADLVPLNDSGVTGRVDLELRDGGLDVRLFATGLVPDELHIQHIHGFPDGRDAVVPPPSAAGDDGVLTIADGLPFYGPVLLPLVPFQTPADCIINYQRFFTNQEIADLAGVPEVMGLADLLPLDLREIVVHGGFVDGVYVTSLPVAAGEIAVIPMPASVWGGLLLLGGMADTRTWKRRRLNAAQ